MHSRAPVIAALFVAGAALICLSAWGIACEGKISADQSPPSAVSPAPNIPNPSHVPTPGTTSPTSDASRSVSSEPASESEPKTEASSSGSPLPLPSQPNLIMDAQWGDADGGRSLQVSPSQTLRDDSNLADQGWAELIKKFPDANLPGMKNQFVCHANFAANKRTWNIEPWRPATSYNRTVLALCNPGPNQEPGSRTNATSSAPSPGPKSST